MSGHLFSLSIVMPCLNRVQFVEAAIESILSQGISGLEIIVADGGSKDGTLDVLRRYPEVQVVSEPDSGLYDALNKAISRASGDIVGHLNTDDIYLPNAFKSVLEAFATCREAQMVCGGAELAILENDGWCVTEEFPAIKYGYLDWETVLKGPILTNARFYRREFLLTCMPFNQKYKIISDREFLIRVKKENPVIKLVPQSVLQYRSHSNSLTFNNDCRAQWRTALEKLELTRSVSETNAEDPELNQVFLRWARYEALQAILIGVRAGSIRKVLIPYRHGVKHSGLKLFSTASYIFNFIAYRFAGRLRNYFLNKSHCDG